MSGGSLTLSGFLNESGKLIGYVLPGLDFSPFLPLTPENTKWQEECLPLVLSGMESVESLFFFRAVGGVGKYSSSWLLPRCRRSSPRCPTAFCQSTHGCTLGRIGPLAMLRPIAILALKA